MEQDFIYWRHPGLTGIKVEEITGGERYEGSTWLDMAYQIYCENGKDGYREIGHFPNGAPFLFNSNGRISITHCRGLLAVATLPDTPEVSLAEYSDRAAMGIDAERRDRAQAAKLRDRFLNSSELDMIPADNVELNVLAWTIKEAVYKAGFSSGVDFRDNILIEKLPKFGPAVPVYDIKEFDYDGSGRGFVENYYGQAVLIRPDGERVPFIIYSYLSDEFLITLAYSPRSARYKKNKN